MKESALFRLDGPSFSGRAESAASGQKCIAPSWNNGVFLVKKQRGDTRFPRRSLENGRKNTVTNLNSMAL